MKRIFFRIFAALFAFAAASSAWATDTATFNLLFEKKPEVLIDFVDPNSPGTTIDSLSFPLVNSSNNKQDQVAKATIRFQVAYRSDLYLVCTRLNDLSGYTASRLEGSGTNAGMLLSSDGNHRLNYSVKPTRTYVYKDGVATEITTAEQWEIDPATWPAAAFDASEEADKNYQTATVATEYRMAKIYSNNPAYLLGDQLVYEGAYTDDIFIDVTFTIDALEDGIVDGVYTGYCHLVLEAT